MKLLQQFEKTTEALGLIFNGLRMLTKKTIQKNFVNKIVALLIILVLSVVFVGLVRGDYTPIPQISPTITPTATVNPNATATSTPTPDLNATVTPSPTPNVIYIDGNQIQSINPNGNPLSLSTYNHTTCYLSYSDADSYSINFTGASNRFHNEQQSTTQMSVVIDGIGTYHFIFTVLYHQVVNQSVTLSIYSGDGTPNIFPIACVNSGFTLEVVITTKVLPQYPSASDIADAQYGMQKKMLTDVTQGQQNTNRFNQIVIGAVVAIVAIMAVVLVLVLRHQRHTDMRINARNAIGYGGGKY